jgi:hypothetical protein
MVVTKVTRMHRIESGSRWDEALRDRCCVQACSMVGPLSFTQPFPTRLWRGDAKCLPPPTSMASGSSDDRPTRNHHTISKAVDISK